MKRILVAVSFAVLAVPAFAAEISAPYEQNQVDRALPNVTQKGERASTGSTQKEGTNPWANDWNFIAPSL
jgi:predicted membrane chloride channel (bestrophin family)